MDGERYHHEVEDQSHEVAGRESAKPGEETRLPARRRLAIHPRTAAEFAQLWGMSLRAAEQVWQPDYDDPRYIDENWYVLVGGQVVRNADVTPSDADQVG